MKAVITIVILFTCQISYTQTDKYSDQLLKIIAEAKNNFKNLKGEAVKAPYSNDTVYLSKVKIEGAAMNFIEKSYPSDSTAVPYFFFSCRLDSGSVDNTRKTVIRYKKMTEKILGTSCKTEAFSQYHGYWTGESQGFYITCPEVLISIVYNILPRSTVSFSHLSVYKNKSD